MKKKLAIKGHPTRGKEVIELLEMLGGKNVEGFIGTDFDELYTIEDNCIIQAYDWNNCVCFTLEEFLEKYPYKVGDKVLISDCSYLQLIIGMKWEGTIKYLVSDDNNIIWWYTAEELKDFNTIKEVESTGFMQLGKTCGIIFNEVNYEKEVELQLGDYVIEVRDGKTYAVLKKPKYPTTYEECWDMLNANEFVEYELMINFYKLINARNAYWKIAGEQLGSCNSWKPSYVEESWEQGSPIKYVIYYDGTQVIKSKKATPSCILAFPTEEMRDAFYENFKELIEACKELL